MGGNVIPDSIFKQLIPNAGSRPRDAMRPSRAFYFSPPRGRGECRVPAAPAASCAIVVIERTRVTTSTPESPGIPARNGFNAYVVLSPVTGLFCHRRQRIKFCLSPVGPTQLRELDASVGASGPHDFAVRCNISRPLAWRSLTGLIDPPCNPIARKTLPRPPHPHPASVTIAIRPLVGWDGANL